MAESRLKSQSPEQRRLIVLMQRINFGEIRDLHVMNGLPVFNPAPEVVRIVKLGAENGSRQERDVADFQIKERVFELLEEIRRLGNGRILRIAIKHGIPTDLTMLGESYEGSGK